MAPTSQTAPRSDSPLRGSDLDGVVHRLGEAEHTKAALVVFLSTTCPISNACLPTLNQIAATHRKKGVEVYGVVSHPTLTREAARKHQAEFDLKFPVLFDATGDLRARLRPTHTPHAFVLSRDGVTRYDGTVDDRYASIGRRTAKSTENHVQDAIAAILASRPVTTAHVKPVGCLMEETPKADKSAAVTFSRDVAPILFGHCARCHRPGQAAPFSLMTYADASDHARQIVEVTKSGFMPPWKPVHGFASFKDERRLNAREIAVLEQWVAGGKAEGNAADLPPAPKFVDGWQLGKPDVVLTMPQSFEVPAATSDLHQHYVLPLHVAETRLISAVEFHPGNARVVHHACFYLDNTGAGRKLDQADPGPGYGGPGGAGFMCYGTLRSWLPGITPRRLADGSGRAVLKGSDLVLEIHYHASGKVESDQSTVGLYFAPKKARQLVGEIQVLDYRLDIPAGAARHRHTASFTVPNDCILLDCAPHMHMLGREVKATATRPDGKVVPLIWIRDWNYLWQEQYEYLDPVRLPKGSRIDVEYWYDNTAGNKLNPFSPPQRVLWGEQSTEEMAVCHFQYTCDRMEDFVAFGQSYGAHRVSQARDILNGKSSPAGAPAPSVPTSGAAAPIDAPR